MRKNIPKYFYKYAVKMAKYEQKYPIEILVSYCFECFISTCLCSTGTTSDQNYYEMKNN